MREDMAESKKKAFLVLGPEGTGTRLFTRILINAGCEGSAGHRQKFDGTLPTQDCIVWRKSFPHRNCWPCITTMVSELRDKDYTVHAFVTNRNWHAILESRGPRHEAGGGTKAVYQHLQKSYPLIFQGLAEAKVPFIVVSYEEMLLRGATYIEKVLELWGLKLQSQLEEITDGNEKYYE